MKWWKNPYYRILMGFPYQVIAALSVIAARQVPNHFDHYKTEEGYQLQLTPIEWIILIALWAECALWGVVVFLLAIVIAIVNCFKNAKKE